MPLIIEQYTLYCLYNPQTKQCFFTFSYEEKNRIEMEAGYDNTFSIINYYQFYEYAYLIEYKSKIINAFVNICMLPIDIIKLGLTLPIVIIWNMYYFVVNTPQMLYYYTAGLLKRLDDYLSPPRVVPINNPIQQLEEEYKEENKRNQRK